MHPDSVKLYNAGIGKLPTTPAAVPTISLVIEGASQVLYMHGDKVLEIKPCDDEDGLTLRGSKTITLFGSVGPANRDLILSVLRYCL
jgi:hypothetical protein